MLHAALRCLQVVDATQRGGIARYVNHSCDPNCYATLDKLDGKQRRRIFLFAKRPIAAGEEVTYDYQFAPEEDRTVCLCAAPNCRGTLN